MSSSGVCPLALVTVPVFPPPNQCLRVAPLRQRRLAGSASPQGVLLVDGHGHCDDVAYEWLVPTCRER